MDNNSRLPLPMGNPTWAGNLVRRFFKLEKPGNLQARTYFWTAFSGGCFCGSSFILLVSILRILGDRGPYWGGVFSIAMAISQQLVTIGLFQMRTYQVSDVDEVFSFDDYFVSRIITVALMMAAAVGLIAFGDGWNDKAAALILLMVLRSGESFSDVLEGRYQQFGRLDIASKGVFYKTFFPMILFCVALWFTKDMLVSLALMVLIYWGLFILSDGVLIRSFIRNVRISNWSAQRALLISCLPLALNAFLFMYVNNMSKYAIDRHLDESKMAEYNALFMLAFLVSLLSGFVLRPALTSMSWLYKNGDRRGFLRQIYIQILWVMAFSLPTLFFSYAFGSQLLTLFYGIDLTHHRGTLCILIAGGALLAVYYILQSVLIIMRRQTVCLVGIIAVIIPGWLVTAFAVKNHGIAGGARSYLLTTALLAAVFWGLTAWYIKRRWTSEPMN